MNYQGTLESGEKLLVGNEGAQTNIQWSKSSKQHNESQGSGFETGVWKSTPKLFETAEGAVLHIEGEKGSFYLQLHDGSLEHLEKVPDLQESDEIKLDETEKSPVMEPMEPLRPMEAMKPLKPLF